MAEREDDDEDRDDDADVVPARVAEEVRDARHEVFRAYVRAREKARELADVDRPRRPRSL